MKRLFIALAAASLSLGLPGCAMLADGPAPIAQQTKIDEQVGLTVTLAYTAAAKAAALAIETKVIKDPATIARIGQLDRQAYDAVLAVRQAYDAGNSTNILSALTRAQGAVAALLDAVRAAS